MRHGTTVWNEKGLTQGRSQNRLSKCGISLVKCRSEEFKNIHFDLIISSPLMRTMQTANIINKYHSVKIVKDERIIEINQGVFTGRHKDSLSDEEKKLKFARSKECGMETFQDVYVRLKGFAEDIKSKYSDIDVFIVTHNACASMLEDIFSNVKTDFGNYKNLSKFGNAEVKCFDI